MSRVFKESGGKKKLRLSVVNTSLEVTLPECARCTKEEQGHKRRKKIITGRFSLVFIIFFLVSISKFHD